MRMSFPEVTGEVLAEVARHNASAGAMLRNWYAHGGVAWTPGMIASAEIVGRLECFAPWAEVARSLRRLARAYLPSPEALSEAARASLPVPEWTPALLLDGGCGSLLEFWAEVPEYAGRVELASEELLPFFCACADPPRFGTASGRYPEQLAALKAEMPPPRMMCDFGCGVGLGTLEAAKALGAKMCIGVTREPLEAWMANERRLPHDARRSAEYARYREVAALFTAGDVCAVRGTWAAQLILCNGLVGGRFLERAERLRRFFCNAAANLAPSGCLALANHFHEGRRASIEAALRLAVELGWRVNGDWRNARLTPASREAHLRLAEAAGRAPRTGSRCSCG